MLAPKTQTFYLLPPQKEFAFLSWVLRVRKDFGHHLANHRPVQGKDLGDAMEHGGASTLWMGGAGESRRVRGGVAPSHQALLACSPLS